MNIPYNEDKEAIIFDFDGVIINSHDVQVRALETAYRRVVGYGEIPFEEFFHLSGDSLENIFTKLNLPLEMVKIYREYSSNNIEMIRVHENIIKDLEFIRNNGVLCALCTGKERLRTEEILKHFNLKQYFKIVICSDDVQVPKPDAESILTIMSKLGVKKKNCIMIGDGLNDIKCARNAGVDSIAVAWGDVAVEDLKREKPHRIAYTVDDLYGLIQDWIYKDEQRKRHSERSYLLYN